MKILTVFFSMKGETIAPGMKVVNLEKGHTSVAAEYIRQAVGGDLFEIETVKTYMPRCRTKRRQRARRRPLMSSAAASITFAAWNAFSLEFTDEDIRPYKAFTVGQMEEKLAALLETAGAQHSCSPKADNRERQGRVPSSGPAVLCKK